MPVSASRSTSTPSSLTLQATEIGVDLGLDAVAHEIERNRTGHQLDEKQPPATKTIAVRDRKINAAVFQNRRKLRSPD